MRAALSICVAVAVLLGGGCGGGSSSSATTFALPAAGTVLTETVRVGVSGDDVTAAVFTLDGAEWARVESPPFEADLDPSLHPAGDAILAVTAILGDGTEVTETAAVVLAPGATPVLLTVEGGTGGGSYLPGTRVAIVAGAPPSGQVFDRWTGDVATVESATAASTFVVVPAGGATVRATYRTIPAGTPGEVSPTVETDPTPGTGDSADDICIWIHPTTPASSTVIGTDKSGPYLLVYGLDGHEIQRISTGRVNNVDLRYNFPLGGSTVALVTVTNRSTDTIDAYVVDPATRRLSAAGSFASSLAVYGLCMYESPLTGDTYVFVNGSAGEVEQWKLDGSSGSVTATLARSFDVGSLCEGCVADDDLSDFYIGEEDSGIWKYGAEPGDGTTRTKVDSTGSGHLAADVEGLTIYYAADGKGYLLASSQGDNTYVVYEREGANAFVLKFSIESGNGLSGASNTDGIDVTAFGLGAAFPQGLFVAQDGGDQNFKLVPWQSIAAAKTPPLTIDTSVDPRLVGK